MLETLLGTYLMLKRLKGDDDSYNKQPVANAYACIDLGHRRGCLDQDRPRSSIKNPGLEVSPGSLDEKLGQEVWSELYQLKIEQPVDYLYESNTIFSDTYRLNESRCEKDVSAEKLPWAE